MYGTCSLARRKCQGIIFSCMMELTKSHVPSSRLLLRRATEVAGPISGSCARRSLELPSLMISHKLSLFGSCRGRPLLRPTLGCGQAPTLRKAGCLLYLLSKQHRDTLKHGSLPYGAKLRPRARTSPARASGKMPKKPGCKLGHGARPGGATVFRRNKLTLENGSVWS